jgi:DNA (cytosine-5)-methyltransferase 1
VPDELASRSSYPCGVSSYPAISLFSGVGGLDLGATAAGFDIRAAVEFESDAASSLRANDPDLVVIEKSIVDMPSEEIREAAGVARGELALIIGGPPCTPFSKSGYWLEYKRRGLDPKASLVDEFARVVVDLMPAAVLMENVHGLAYDNHNRGPFGALLGRLTEAGYRLSWQVLNAADYGVPQLRKRLFVVGTLGGREFVFPPATHSGWTETKRTYDRSLPAYVTSRDAIGDLESREDLRETEEEVNGEYGHLLREVPPGDNYLHFTEKRGHPSPRFEWRTRYWTFLLKLDPDRPSTTIQSQPGPYVGPFHWTSRRLRKLEAMRLQTFPDDYQIVGSRRSAQIQIGNAVPPHLAEVVARALREAMDGRRASVPESQLGLSLDVALAAGSR